MSTIHRTMIVAAQDVSLARSLAAAAAPGSGEGMFLRQCRTKGQSTVTHYISAGLIQEEFAAMRGAADATFAATAGAVPLEAIAGMYQRATFIEDEPFAVMESLGLEFADEAS